MVGITPTEIGKHSRLIKLAQEEMTVMDVMVCGRCHNVFHFHEEFKQHKLKSCQKESSHVRECSDTKPKIWAFLLWKATQLQNNKDNNTATPTSWSLYQSWMSMDSTLRDTWIIAGKTIQSFAKAGQGSVGEMPVKITKTVVNNNAETITQNRKPLAPTKPQLGNIKTPAKLPVAAKVLETENETAAAIKTSPQMQKVAKKTVSGVSSTVLPISPSKSNNISTTPRHLSRTAKRTTQISEDNANEIVEENVEKIVAKRFNPRRKMHEYLVKWENRNHDLNTWEPASHLEEVPHLLETFEKQLARQKESRAALQAKSQAAAQLPSNDSNQKSVPQITKTIILKSANEDTGTSADASNNIASSPSAVNERPTRSSKIKAMDQVKQWVSAANSSVLTSPSPADSATASESEKELGNTSTDSIGAGVKRKMNNSDFNNSADSEFPTTTATMEDLEEDLIPSHTVKRMKNGNSVSVEVKTKTDKSVESKVFVNGGSAAVGSGDISLKAEPFSAEIIITQDAAATGVVKKPGVIGPSSQKRPAQVRVLPRGDSNSGIVRIGSGNASITPKVSTPTPTVSNRQNVQRTAGGNTIQRKTFASAGTGSNPAQRTAGVQGQTRTTVSNSTHSQQQTSPSSGRMIIPRQSNASNPPRTPTVNTKHVTPEQKILQLSKSGDLKVTKKVMTREDAAQRMATQQRQQQQQTTRQQLQSQLQIQKVQNIATPVAPVIPTQRGGNARKSSENYEHQAQICPITGKIVGQDGQENLQQQLVAEQQQLDMQQEPAVHDMESNLLLSTDQQMLTNDDGSPLLVHGEDGTVYQVAGKNSEGHTILVTQGPDGEQQYAYVAAPEGEENQMMTLDNAVAEAVAQLPAEQQAVALAAAAGEGGQYLVKTTQEDGTTQVVTMTAEELAHHQAIVDAQHQQISAGGAATGQLCIQTGDGGDAGEGNIPAEVVQADMPSPGGTRRVVLLLQDGTYMMTEMHDDEFKSLNLNA